MRSFIRLIEQASSVISEYRKWHDDQPWGSKVMVYLTEDSLEENSLHIDSIAVPKYLKKKGIGKEILTKLMLLCKQHNKALTLEVDESSEDADWLHGWYTRYGFVEHDEGYGSYGPFMVWNSLNEALIEGVNDDFLYHSTDILTAARILYQDTVENRTTHVQNIRLKFDSIGVRQSELNKAEGLPSNVEPVPWIKGVSLTRSLLFAKSWRTGGVVFAFDRKLLRQRYRIRPLTYLQRHKEHSYNIPESEEFLIGSLKNVSRYLTGIYVSKETFDQILYTREQDEGYDIILKHPKLIVQDKKWMFLTRS